MTLTNFCTACNTEAHSRIIQQITDEDVITQYCCSNCAVIIATIIIPRNQFPNFEQWKVSFDQLTREISSIPTAVPPPTVN